MADAFGNEPTVIARGCSAARTGTSGAGSGTAADTRAGAGEGEGVPATFGRSARVVGAEGAIDGAAGGVGWVAGLRLRLRSTIADRAIAFS